MLRQSRYNFWSRAGSKHLLFNGMTGALFELSEPERHAADSALCDPQAYEDLALVEQLRLGGFVVPDGLDEVSILLERYRAGCEAHGVLEVTISPTYECNFRCRYCYVDFVAGRMSSEVGDRVVRYVEKAAADYQQVNISWFGGEPLLCLAQVCHMSRQLTEVAERRGIRLLLFLSTNGYLLDKSATVALYDAGVAFFHVTVDGPAVYHDDLRVPAAGGPSYRRIVDNVITVLSDLPQSHVTLRMNVNESNVEGVAEVLDELPKSERDRVQVNITPILLENSLPSSAVYRKINHAVGGAIEGGFRYYDMQIPVGRRTHCAADKRGNFHIGPDGALYKCSPSGKPEVHVGWLDQHGEPQLNANYDIWHSVPPFRDQCTDCPFLCFCAGGCRLERLRGDEDRHCQDRYADMRGMVLNRYLAAVNNAL